MKQNFLFVGVSIIIGTTIFLSLVTQADGKFNIRQSKSKMTSSGYGGQILPFYWNPNIVLFSGTSLARKRRNVEDEFNNARRNIEEAINDACVLDEDCNGHPAIECVHEGKMLGNLIGECKFTWWFILILVLIALIIIGGILSCLCSPCCCLYECMRNLCCCC